MITNSLRCLEPKDCETQREAEAGLDGGNVKERHRMQNYNRGNVA